MLLKFLSLTSILASFCNFNTTTNRLLDLWEICLKTHIGFWAWGHGVVYWAPVSHLGDLGSNLWQARFLQWLMFSSRSSQYSIACTGMY
jgi:hypothetical protein